MPITERECCGANLESNGQHTLDCDNENDNGIDIDNIPGKCTYDAQTDNCQGCENNCSRDLNYGDGLAYAAIM